VKSFLSALAFLTRFPIGGFDAADVAQSAGWFPLIGALLGAFYTLTAAVLKDHLPSGVIAVLLVILDALVTGALHFDGLADTADGFGGGKTREDVLRIMRDHAIGSYGGLALVLVVALKVAIYATLLNRADWIAALILTPTLGRWSILLLTASLPYARQSTSVIDGMGKRSLIQGTAVILVVLVAAQSARVWIAMAAVLGVTAAFGFYCRHRIAGITGDTLGANLELCESAALLTFIWAGHPQ
jgi:adenosylcobinamide-GDP ribazoletransferase